MSEYVRVNKQKMGDCLKQCMEDYMTATEDAIKTHAQTFLPSERFALGQRIEHGTKRIQMIMHMMHELGVRP